MIQRQKFGGRAKGTPNKAKVELRQRFTSLLESNFDTIQSDLNTLEPKERIKTQIYKSKISLNVVSISSTSFCVNAENSFFRERTESVPFPCSKNPTKRETILSGISYL